MKTTETVSRYREDRRLNEACATAKALEVWATFTDDEKALVRFGMFPAKKDEAAVAELIAAGVPKEDAGRLLAVALMECAERDGGMRA